MKNQTKERIADALIESAKKQNIESIHVTDLCQKVGCSKQTFYNHFLDKYDVISWIFAKTVYTYDPSGECYYSLEALEKALNAIWENRNFFRVAFLSEGQNALRDYILQKDVEFNTQILCEVYQLTTLNEQLLFSVKYHLYGCLGYIKEWLVSNSTISPKELAELEYRYMPEELKKAWASKPKNGQHLRSFI